jgi:hypothetical protein
MSQSQALWVSFLLTLVLAVFHWLAPRLRRLPGIPERVITSFSGGFAVSFVFLHMLPGLLESRDTIGEFLGRQITLTPLVDLGVYCLALLGLVTFMGLEFWARAGVREVGGAKGVGTVGVEGESADISGEAASTRRFFYVHLGSFALYNFLITYTLPLRVEAGWAYALIFTLAMALHFIINDRSFEAHHAQLFNRQGRLVLLGALCLGWILATTTEFDHVLTVALLSAFLGGAILFNVIKEEVPSSESDSSFTAFVVGLALGAILLLLVTAVEG